MMDDGLACFSSSSSSFACLALSTNSVLAPFSSQIRIPCRLLLLFLSPDSQGGRSGATSSEKRQQGGVRAQLQSESEEEASWPSTVQPSGSSRDRLLKESQ